MALQLSETMWEPQGDDRGSAIPTQYSVSGLPAGHAATIERRESRWQVQHRHAGSDSSAWTGDYETAGTALAALQTKIFGSLG
jgi:hypothetical protein